MRTLLLARDELPEVRWHPKTPGAQYLRHKRFLWQFQHFSRDCIAKERICIERMWSGNVIFFFLPFSLCCCGDVFIFRLILCFSFWCSWYDSLSVFLLFFPLSSWCSFFCLIILFAFFYVRNVIFQFFAFCLFTLSILMLVRWVFLWCDFFYCDECGDMCSICSYFRQIYLYELIQFLWSLESKNRSHGN